MCPPAHRGAIFMQFTWQVKNSERGMTLENFIYQKLKDWSHKQVKSAIDQKRAFVNGRCVFMAKWNLKPRDRVQFVPNRIAVPPHVRQRMERVDVLFEDADILAVNKPAFIESEDFAAVVLNYLKRKTRGRGHPYLGQMHRLDKETSGVMIFTKKKQANELADQFRRHTIRKYYLAVVNGRVAAQSGQIKEPLEKGAFGEGRKVRVARGKEGAREAKTFYEVVERYETATLLRVRIFTGRTHQIRVHLSDAGYPLVGDTVYCGPHGMSFRRCALHAERLEFVHPVTKQKIKITAPLPEDMKKLIAELRGIF